MVDDADLEPTQHFVVAVVPAPSNLGPVLTTTSVATLSDDEATRASQLLRLHKATICSWIAKTYHNP